jgi:hypothetical protein
MSKNRTSPAAGFASSLLFELRQRDDRASVLCVRPGSPSKEAVIGLLDDGEFIPLLKVGAASAAFNVMGLFVPHHGRWMPTFQRGTPEGLAALLAGPLHYLWTLAVSAQGFSSDPSVQ